MKASVWRSPWFWVAHAVFFALCIAYTLSRFDSAFPFLELQIRMDRQGALREAALLASKRGWPPADRREAVEFESDSLTQNFVELEAGGAPALKQLLAEGIVSPYSWRVRHFAVGDPRETEIRFMPDGRPYGFAMRLPETDPGAALRPEAARALAEKAARDEWGADLSAYSLAESSSETRPSGRVDHQLIYERIRERVGDARYRLRLEVSGDRLTGLAHFVKVPEAFRRRYAVLRSANGAISDLAAAAIALVYGLGICGYGLLRLARQRLLDWRAPIVVAGVIASLHALERINRFPLAWIGYDTAVEVGPFAIKYAAGALIGALLDFVMVAIPLVAAEALSRLAFPGQPQISRLLSREGASSVQALGRVAGAYLLVGFHFAWVTWMYGFGSRKLGWWNPSELLFHPDALSAYMPWLTSVANSLHAGVWEECLFRALPLAAAAMLGRRFGKRGAWIAAAFVAQAVVFGAAHASYPTQPSYARLVELLVPSAVFGGVYLAFGLLPGILMHYTYDVVLFALPVFQSSGAVARLNGAAVVAVSLFPLIWVLVARWRAGKWTELSPALYNGAWRAVAPGQAEAHVRAHASVAPAERKLGARGRRILAFSGLAGLAIWAALGARTRPDAPPLLLDRAEAIAIARAALESEGVAPGPDWKALGSVAGEPGEDDEFVWRTSGPDAYGALLGTYLDPPQWVIRFARFDGDVVERAEEWQVFVGGSGKVLRIRHELPESRAAKRLELAEARSLATRALAHRYGVAPVTLTEVSSNQYQLPGRRDWLFVWRDPSVVLKQGEARVAVKLAGDEVVGYRRYVHVPEEWVRAERGRRTLLSVVRMLGGVFVAGIALWLAFAAFRDWARGRFDRRAFVGVFVAGVCAGAVTWLNRFAGVEAGFNTAQPWRTQFLQSVVAGSVAALVATIGVALLVGRAQAGVARPDGQGLGQASGLDRWAGYAAGAWIAAAGAAVSWLGRGALPAWPSYAAASASIPGLESVQGVASFVLAAAALQLLLPWVREVLRSSAKRAVFFAALGFAVAALSGESSVAGLLAGAAFAALALGALSAFFRYVSTPALVPLAASLGALEGAQALWARPFPGAIACAALAAAAIGSVSWFWYGALAGRDRSPELDTPGDRT